MGIKDTLAWYQSKIGTYDKQQWETLLEQKEKKHFYGFKNLRTRSTKPNTNLIDLDLIRGSSFPKAKPRYGFLSAAKSATLRLFFLPFYYNWWIRKTSRNIFLFILSLYLAEIVNTYIYYTYTSVVETISLYDIIVPLLIMWVLCLMISYIMATDPEIDQKRRSRTLLNGITRRVLCVVRENNRKLQFKDIDDNENKSSSNLHKYKPNIDDDGFESFNGNGSRTSEEEVAQNASDCNENNAIISDNANNVKNSTDKNPESIFPNKTNTGSSNNSNNIERPQTFYSENEDCASTDTTESDKEIFEKRAIIKKQLLTRRQDFFNKKNICRRNSQPCDTKFQSYDSEKEVLSNSEKPNNSNFYKERPSSANEWVDMTENGSDDNLDIDSEVCSDGESDAGSINLEGDLHLLKVSCTIWERHEIRKANLTTWDISSAIIRKVDSMPERTDYFYMGIALSMIIASLPIICRLCHFNYETFDFFSFEDIYKKFSSYSLFLDEELEQFPGGFSNVVDIIFGKTVWERVFVIIATTQRLLLAVSVFFLICVAEHTFKQRLLCAKLFSHLTSSRRAPKSDLPHFRLNKVANIKAWLSIRAYLKKRGPQRSVDVIVSTTFIITVLLFVSLGVEILKETVTLSRFYLEALLWCLGLGINLLRFMTLGTKINQKYRSNLSILITEQLNLYLQLDKKPRKKDEVTIVNSVLKLAIDLLKELENPFKISGISANPILYNVTKLVILSALSAILSEILGFKLKLHKIKLK